MYRLFWIALTLHWSKIYWQGIFLRKQDEQDHDFVDLMHWAFLRRNRGRVAIQFDCPHKRCNLSIEQFPIFAALIQVCGNTTSKFDKQYKLGQVFHIALWCCNRIAGLKHRIARFRVDM